MVFFDFLDFGGQLSLPSILVYLASYFVIERIIKKTFRYFFPVLFEQLLRERKDAQTFAFFMGILITAVSTPVCYKALKDSNDSNDVLGKPNLSTAGQICVASRSVLWASELNRLDHSNGYIVHHLSSLGYLVYHLQFKFPLRIIYAFNASLLTELFSDLACLLTVFGFKACNSALAYRIQVTNTFLLVILRIPPIIYAASFLPMNSMSDPVFWVNAACLLIYARFVVNTILAASIRLRIFEVVSKRPAYVRVAQSVNIPIYGAFFSLASFVTAVLSGAIYSRSTRSTSNSADSTRLNIQLLLTGFAAFIGARLPYVLGQHGASAIFSSKLLSRSDLWLQGGTSAAALSIVASPLTERSQLLFSFCLALPIGEAIGRIGCYYAGCCGGHGGQLRRIPVQLKSAFLNVVAGTAVLLLHIFTDMQLEKAAMFLLAANAIIRIILRPNAFAVAQLIFAMAMIGFTTPWAADGNWPLHPILNNQTDNGFSFQPGHDGAIRTVLEVSKTPWTAILALASLAGGGFVQGCSGGEVALGLKESCGGEVQLGLNDSCGGGEATLRIIQGCGGGEAQLGLNESCGGSEAILSLQRGFSTSEALLSHHARLDRRIPVGLVQGCGGGD
jgi:hypothetical protein